MNMFFPSLNLPTSAAILFLDLLPRGLAASCQSKIQLSALQISPFCSRNFTFVRCLELIDMLLANQNTDIFVCVFLIKSCSNTTGKDITMLRPIIVSGVRGTRHV